MNKQAFDAALKQLGPVSDWVRDYVLIDLQTGETIKPRRKINTPRKTTLENTIGNITERDNPSKTV